VISRGLAYVLGVLIGVGYGVVLAATVEDDQARTALAVAGAVLIAVGTIAAGNAADDGPPTAH
jgi:hypothetical protein